MNKSVTDSNEYYYLEGDERIGPFSRERLTALLKNGILPPHTKVVANNAGMRCFNYILLATSHPWMLLPGTKGQKTLSHR